MEKIWTVVKRLAKEEEGTETVEWAIVAGLVLLAAGAAWASIGGKVATAINGLDTALP